MRDDRPSRSARTEVEVHGATLCEMDVTLTRQELAVLAGQPVRVPRGYSLQPWVRIEWRGTSDDRVSCGVEVVGDDDGA